MPTKDCLAELALAVSCADEAFAFSVLEARLASRSKRQLVHELIASQTVDSAGSSASASTIDHFGE
ncbi:MAG: hypothetical protein NXI14_06960 [bacterium]|nr:hypothetical protein [bacterium]